MSRYVNPGVTWAVMIFVCGSMRVAFAQPAQIEPSDTVEYANIVASTSIVLPSPDESGIGSRFGDRGDKLVGGRMACAPHDHVDSEQHVCAHRRYPCGTILIIEYHEQRSWCVVADRGPYGANVFASDGTMLSDTTGHPAWYIMIHPGDPPPIDLCADGNCKGRWRGIVDMSPAVSKSMGHPGMGSVRVWRLKRVVDYVKYLARKQLRPTT